MGFLSVYLKKLRKHPIKGNAQAKTPPAKTPPLRLRATRLGLTNYRFRHLFPTKRLAYSLTIPCLKGNSKFLVDELIRVTVVF